MIRQTVAAISLGLFLPFGVTCQPAPVQRSLRPEDLFHVRQVGATAWSADGRLATIELSRPGRWLDTSLPSSEIALLDVKTNTLRTVSSNATRYLGFFSSVWSPDGRRLAFLSVDASAVIQAWIWTVGAGAPQPVRGLDVRFAFNEPSMVWVDNDRLALSAWDVDAEKSGPLFFRVLRGANSAAQWKRALEAQSASVSVLESGRSAIGEGPSGRLVLVDLHTNTRATLARGNIHRLNLSADRRQLTFLKERPGTPIASYFEFGSDVEKAYAAVNWGTERHVIDARSGAKVDSLSILVETPKPSTRIDSTIPPPRADARRLSTSPDGAAALYLATIADGTHLWLCGGDGRPMSRCSEIWRANEWMQEIKTGRVESINYNATDGTPLTAWLLLPPDHVTGTKLPVITHVYPGTIYNSRQPASFSLYRTDFNHPQLFAALGYAVLLPSMPEPKDPADAHTLTLLANGVLPAVDAVFARGIADPDRIGLIGQSDGGFATIGLITQTNRFRSAIASAGFSNLISLYGTFYGQNRYGDSGPPEKGQQLRVLQMEKGSFALGGPPWVKNDLYRDGSPIFHADKVQTPLMLIHGDLDNIPIQQAEEFFTALYRQDKRARLVRYHGEWHTISNRANVLDLWKRIAEWLSETMAVRHQGRL